MNRKARRRMRELDDVPPATVHAAPDRAPGIFAVAVYDVAEFLVLRHRDAPVHGVGWPDIWLDVGTALVYHGWKLPAPDAPETRALLSAAFIVGWTGRQAVEVVRQFLQDRPNLPPMTFHPELEKALAAGIADGCWLSLGEQGRTLMEHGWQPGMLRQ